MSPRYILDALERCYLRAPDRKRGLSDRMIRWLNARTRISDPVPDDPRWDGVDWDRESALEAQGIKSLALAELHRRMAAHLERQQRGG